MRIPTTLLLLACGLVVSGLPAHAQDREYEVPLKTGDTAVKVGFQLESTRSEWSRIVANLSNGKHLVFPLRVESASHRLAVTDGGVKSTRDISVSEAVINFDKLVTLYVRPRLQRYTDAQQQELLNKWAVLPAASEHQLTFEARQETDGIALYVDGQYAGFRETPGKLQSLTVQLPPKPGSEFELEDKLPVAVSYRPAGDPRYLPLDVSIIARPGAMKTAKPSLPPGLRTLDGVPVQVVGGAQSVDVGVVKQMKGSWALECDEHLSRTALDGMPETAHFSVPEAPYTRAWVLCAVADDPALDPILTARLTRFARSGRGGAISDTSMVLPRGDEPPGEGVVQVGTIAYGEGDGQRTVPLFLVEFRLKPGEILDLLSMTSDPNASMTTQPYLDFEFLGRLGGIGAQWDSRHKPNNRSTSAVHVFGATLERSPVGLALACGQPGNVYADGEPPVMTATLTAWRPGPAKLAWRITNLQGDLVSEQRRDLSFDQTGATQTIEVPLSGTPPLAKGWYGIEFTLDDGTGREMIRHQAAFALVAPDQRRARYDSPYGTWWFARAHYGAGDKAIVGPLMSKAGLRKTTFGWTKYGEADLAEWAITQNQIGWRTAPRDLEHPEAAMDEAEKNVREQLERFPHCRSADVLHESFAHYVPEELLDRPQVDSPEDAAKGKALVATATLAATFYRQRFPDVKLLVGNTSSSASIIAALFRYGFDPKLIDYIGVEAPGQTCMPEKLWEGGTQGIWLAREVARKFGHDLPVTGCYEFTARTERTLGPVRHAEWVVRDMLLCHAYRFDHINPAILHDAGNAYYNTLWGAGGLCQRFPLLYPKPAYVGVATLTRVLDRVKLLRRVDTGSITVYALEFARDDGKTVYALWTAVGEARLRVTFPAGATTRLIGFTGQEGLEQAVPESLEAEIGPAPVYLESSAPGATIAITERRFAPPPPDFAVASRLDRLEDWELATDDTSLSNPTARGLPIRQPGGFDLAAVDDTERGACLELTLKREGTVPDIVSEYAVLRLKSPVQVPGTPTAIGLWVKGDSGWGKVIFEIEDAGGNRWRTEGYYHDWPGDLAICHDGWRFVGFPIDGSSTALNLTPGRRWNAVPRSKSATIEFPIRIVGLDLVLNRKALDLSEMKTVPGVIRLQALGTAGQPASAAR